MSSSAAPRDRFSRWRRRLQWIGSVGQLAFRWTGLLIPRSAPEIRGEQAKNLRVSALVFALFGSAGVLLMMREFFDRIGNGGIGLAAAIILLYLAWALAAFLIGRRSTFVLLSHLLLVGQGLFWAGLMEQFANIAEQGQGYFIVIMAMALVSTPMLATPFSIAFSFWAPVAIGTAAIVGWRLKPINPELGICFISYELFTLVGIVILNRIILDHAESRLELRAKNETVQMLLREYEENASDWLWETDSRYRLRGVTPRFAEVIGRHPRDVEGRPIAEALNLGHTRAEGGGDLLATLELRRGFTHLVVRLLVQNAVKWWLVSGKAIVDDAGYFKGFRGVASDITEAHQAEETASYLATHDVLTGIGNRWMFRERIAQACTTVGARAAAGFALLMIDLDRFKEVNDSHGHEAGDHVLRIVGEKIRSIVRATDTIARLGGDEFAVILPGRSRKDAEATAARVIRIVEEQMSIAGAWLGVGASIGIALCPQHGTDPEELTRHADLALLRAKSEGRGNHRTFQTSFGTEFHDRVSLLADLRAAVSDNSLDVHYQPIVDVSTGCLRSTEALARWHHHRRGNIAPAVFIPLAEECGLISALGAHILRTACRDASAWSEPTKISINLSPLQLKDPGFSAMVEEVVRDARLEPARLELEVTESAWLRGDHQMLEQLTKLEAFGAKIVLDDFGSGWSSLSTLHNFRFHGLKLDAEFTRDIISNAKSGATVRLVAQFARELGIEVTAEGIETDDQLQAIKAAGIDRAQGYLFGRPAPLRSSLAIAGAGCPSTESRRRLLS